MLGRNHVGLDGIMVLSFLTGLKECLLLHCKRVFGASCKNFIRNAEQQTKIKLYKV